MGFVTFENLHKVPKWDPIFSRGYCSTSALDLVVHAKSRAPRVAVAYRLKGFCQDPIIRFKNLKLVWEGY